MSSLLVHKSKKNVVALLKASESGGYPTDDWVHDADLSNVGGVDSKYWKITGAHPNESITEMSQAEKDSVDNDPMNLAALKLRRRKEIDAKTDNLIALGFSYDGEVFSAGLESQSNWHWLLSFAQNNWVTFPVSVSRMDDDEYELANAAAIDSFVQTGFSQIKAHLDSGRVLKKSVFDAADKAAVDAVVDNR